MTGETPHHAQGEQEAAGEANAPAAAANVGDDAKQRRRLRRPRDGPSSFPEEVDTAVKTDNRPPHRRKPIRPLDKRRKPVNIPLPHHVVETPQTTRQALAHFTWVLPWRRT